MKKPNEKKELEKFLIFMVAIILGIVIGVVLTSYMILGQLWDILYSCAWTQGYAYAWNISGV